MTESFLLGLGVGTFFGMFVYYVFIAPVHYTTAMAVMTEKILNRITHETYSRGHGFGVTIDKIITRALANFIILDDQRLNYHFHNSRLLIEEMIERHSKETGGFLKTLTKTLKVYADVFTSRKNDPTKRL